MFRFLAALAIALGLIAGPAHAEFVYTPSAHAIRGTIDGVNVAIDVRSRSDQMGTYLQLAMLQQVDPTHWDYVGNQPVNGRAPDPNLGNGGMMWELVLSSMTTYRSPNMPQAQSQDALVILNTQAPTMLSDWVPRMNAVLAGVFAPGKPPQPLQPAPPAKPAAPFADWQQGRDYLLQALDGFHLVGRQVVPKGRHR